MTDAIALPSYLLSCAALLVTVAELLRIDSATSVQIKGVVFGPALSEFEVSLGFVLIKGSPPFFIKSVTVEQPWSLPTEPIRFSLQLPFVCGVLVIMSIYLHLLHLKNSKHFYHLKKKI